MVADSPLEAALLRDAADDRWDEHSLFSAAEIASGVSSPAQLAAANKRFAQLAEELRRSVTNVGTAEERAKLVLAFLHRRLLPAGYDLQATELPMVFAEGRFNCVSATVLFNSLAREAGLDARAVRKPNHTCSVLVEGGRTLRVEATCTDWLDAGKPAPQDETSGQACINLDSDHSLRQVSDVALISMIYYNRGVEALRLKNYQQAISLNRRALVLDPGNTEATGNLLAAFGRRAMELMAQHDFESALQAVNGGLAVDPDHAPLLQLRQIIERPNRQSGSIAPAGNRRPAAYGQ